MAHSKPPARPTNRTSRRGRQVAVLVTVGLAAAGILAAILLKGHNTNSVSSQYITPANRARTYSQISDCLLTEPAGIQGPLASAVWNGMQTASAATHAQVSYLALQGPDTIANAEIYINTLAMRGCSTVIAAGQIPAAAAIARAAAWPHQRMITVTGTAPPTPASRTRNLTAISGSATSVTSQVRTVLTAGASIAAPTS